MLPTPSLLLNINRYNDLAFPLPPVLKSKNLTVPNNSGCLQPCLNNVVRNRSSIKKNLKNPTTENRLTITRYINTFKLIRKERESRYYLDRFSECTNNLSKTWKVIKQILNSKGDPGLPDSFKLGDRVTLDKFTIANAFNQGRASPLRP